MLIDLVRKNRSYRGYDHSRKVTDEELRMMVEAARLCPSSVNAQPLKYCLINSEDTVAAVQNETIWAKRLSGIKLPHPGKEPTAFILICQDTEIDANPARYQRDVGAVAQTMLLTAVEMGLGGCMIGSFNAENLHRILHLNDCMKPLLVVAVGKPDEEVVMTEAVDGRTDYYRDEADRHYVPKRPLDELIIS